RRPGDSQMRVDRSALLGEARHVDDAGPLALDVRGHAQDGADGDHARAADAVDDARPACLQRKERRLGHAFERVLAPGGSLRLLQPRAVYGDEGGAEPVQAGEVLVAGGLVDTALAAEFGLDGLHGHAVRRNSAVAATLAHQLVDDDAAVGIGKGAALAPPALFGGAGLVVDENRHALDLAQAALDLVHLVAMMDGDAGRKTSRSAVFLRLVGDDGDALDAFGAHLVRDHVDGKPALV